MNIKCNLNLKVFNLYQQYTLYIVRVYGVCVCVLKQLIKQCKRNPGWWEWCFEIFFNMDIVGLNSSKEQNF